MDYESEAPPESVPEKRSFAAVAIQGHSEQSAVQYLRRNFAVSAMLPRPLPSKWLNTVLRQVKARLKPLPSTKCEMAT